MMNVHLFVVSSKIRMANASEGEKERLIICPQNVVSIFIAFDRMKELKEEKASQIEDLKCTKDSRVNDLETFKFT